MEVRTAFGVVGGADALAAASKLSRQMKTLRENFGVSSIVAIVALATSFGSIIYYQTKFNTAVEARADYEASGQKELAVNLRFISDAIVAMRTDIQKATDASQHTQEDVRGLKLSSDTQMAEIRSKQESLFLYATKLDTRMGMIEAKMEGLRLGK